MIALQLDFDGSSGKIRRPDRDVNPIETIRGKSPLVPIYNQEALGDQNPWEAD